VSKLVVTEVDVRRNYDMVPPEGKSDPGLVRITQ
jgi:hypothetical protein